MRNIESVREDIHRDAEDHQLRTLLWSATHNMERWLLFQGVGFEEHAEETRSVCALFGVVGHEINRRAGWWSNIQTGRPIERNVGELLMLMVSEIIEAQDNIDGMDDHLPQYIGMRVEFADCLIRLSDVIGGWKMEVEFADAMVDLYKSDPNSAVSSCNSTGNETIRYLSHAFEHMRKSRREPVPALLAKAVFSLLDGARYLDCAMRSPRRRDYRNHTLADPLRDKLAYNAQRADHKIENRILADGKKF